MSFNKKDGKGGWLGDKITSIAKKVSDASGAHDLVDYAGAKIAKKFASPEAKKYVEDKTSGVKALKSAGKLGMTISSVVGAGAMAKGAAGVVAKQVAKQAAKRQIAKDAVKKASMNRILAAHRSGGDARMLKTLKNSNGAYNELPRKVPVKSSNLDRLTFENRRRGILEPDVKFRVSTKRADLKRKLQERAFPKKQSHLSRTEKGMKKTFDRQWEKRKAEMDAEESDFKGGW